MLLKLPHLAGTTMLVCMSKGAVTISIDLELAWGNWDNLEAYHMRNVEQSERIIVRRLIEIFDRHRLPVTWAFVAALLDHASAKGRQGGERLWYAPDVIDTIRSAKISHDLGSHGGRHRYFDAMTEEQADEDLAFAKHVHQMNGFSFKSFVYPRNKVAKKHLLERYGIKVYRGEDHAWHQRIRSRQPHAGRVANLIDKMLPISPEAVLPERSKALINLPGSMLFLGRDGVRRFASPSTTATKLRKGMAAAISSGGVFHLWFHPSNFWHDPESQFATFDSFAARLADRAGRGEIEVKPMAAFS